MSDTETEPTAFDEVLAEQPDTLLSESKPSGPIETMRDLAEQSDSSSDLSWIPQHLRRDTIEDTTRLLLDVQKEAQRKITEQAERVRELEQALIAQYEDPTYEQPVYDQFAPEQLAYAPPQVDPRQLAAMASQVVQEKLLTPRAAALADEAEQIVVSQIPAYAVDREKVLEAVQRNPSLISAAVDTGDARQIAGALASVHQSLAGPSQVELMRTMKIQAQTAVGAGGRTFGVSDGEQRWQEISNANTGKLGL